MGNGIELAVVYMGAVLFLFFLRDHSNRDVCFVVSVCYSLVVEDYIM